MEANLEKKDVNRKDFLSMAILAIGGVISFAIGIPAVAYILGPALRKADSSSAQIGKSLLNICMSNQGKSVEATLNQ